MSQSLEQIRSQCDSQLDLTLRLVQVNGIYAEKMMASHFAMLQGLLQKTSVPKNHSDEQSWLSFNEQGIVVAGYCKNCLREGLDYQRQVLAELSRK